MDKRMKELQEENRKLRNKLEQIKNKVSTATVGPVTLTSSGKEVNMQTPSSITAENRKSKRKEKERDTVHAKRNSHPDVTPLERRGKNFRIRRVLSYPLDNRRSIFFFLIVSRRRNVSE